MAGAREFGDQIDLDLALDRPYSVISEKPTIKEQEKILKFWVEVPENLNLKHDQAVVNRHLSKYSLKLSW